MSGIWKPKWITRGCQNIYKMLRTARTSRDNMLIWVLVIGAFRSYGAASMSITIPNVINPREALQSGQTRTYFDIIWSCASTLFICTWVAVHPNIPPRGEGHIRWLWRRIKLMLWTLLVPELVFVWAYRQWSAARYIAKHFQGECEVAQVSMQLVEAL